MSRLVPGHVAEGWEKELQGALRQCLARQEADVRLALRRRTSQPRAVTAASSRGKTAVLAAAVLAGLWSRSLWANSVGSLVAPVAAGLATSARSVLRAGLPASATYGMATPLVDAAPNTMTSSAMAAGNALGDRLDANLASVSTLDDADGVVDDLFATAGDILDTSVASQGFQLANLGSADVLGFVSGLAGDYYSGATATWRTQGDDRVRPAHADAEGQEVAANEPFVVGGEELLCPGDPAGSDENIIGCRCWVDTEGVLPEGEEDTPGNPLEG